MLDPRVESSLRDAYSALSARGELLSNERLETAYATFRRQFGPDVLVSLDGVSLLQKMHAHGNKDSLAYWLEFKNDDEFPGPKMGSIAGGSAHKFGLFRRKSTGEWISGSNNRESSISEDGAVLVARKHRDQLLHGVNLLEALPYKADDALYLGLQRALEREAPELFSLAWAHKYWSLLFPQKLRRLS